MLFLRSSIPLDLAAATGEVAHNVAHILLGGLDLDSHDRLEQLRIGLLEASLIAMEPAILKAASEESTSW